MGVIYPGLRDCGFEYLNLLLILSKSHIGLVREQRVGMNRRALGSVISLGLFGYTTKQSYRAHAGIGRVLWDRLLASFLLDNTDKSSVPGYCY